MGRYSTCHFETLFSDSQNALVVPSRVLFQRLAVTLHSEREQQHFLPWNQIHNQEEHGEWDWISGGWLNLRSLQGNDELPYTTTCQQEWYWLLQVGSCSCEALSEGRFQRKRNYRSFCNTEKWLFFHYTSETKIFLKTTEKKDEGRIRTKTDNKNNRQSIQMVCISIDLKPWHTPPFYAFNF